MSTYLPSLDDHAEPNDDDIIDEACDELDPFEIVARREERVGMPMFFMPRSLIED